MMKNLNLRASLSRVPETNKLNLLEITNCGGLHYLNQ